MRRDPMEAAVVAGLLCGLAGWLALAVQIVRWLAH